MDLDPRGRVRRTVNRAGQVLRRAFTDQQSTERVARSFSLGLFVAMLPTVGVGPTILLACSAVVDRLNKLAVVAAVIVCNPLVKPLVYALGLGVGFLLLGPIDGVALTEASLSAAPNVLVRLLVGNVVLAAVVAALGYVVAFRAIDRNRRYRSPLGEIAE